MRVRVRGEGEGEGEGEGLQAEERAVAHLRVHEP